MKRIKIFWKDNPKKNSFCDVSILNETWYQFQKFVDQQWACAQEWVNKKYFKKGNFGREIILRKWVDKILRIIVSKKIEPILAILANETLVKNVESIESCMPIEKFFLKSFVYFW